MTGSTRFARFRRTAPALALALAAPALAACGAEQSAPSRPSSASPQQIEGGLTLQGTWPLTGLPASGRAPRWPVVVVKMDNTVSSRPQVGLDRADLVTEELVEGGYTRLAAFYYSRLPAQAGPVRSMRASDIGFVKPAKATIITSGAAPMTYGRLRKAGVRWIENYDKKPKVSYREGFSRSNSREKPYNLFINRSRLVHNLKPPAQVPAAYLPWGSGADFARQAGKASARSITAQFSPEHITSWRYRGGRYVNTNSNAGKPFPATNILVLRVKERDAGYLDPAGNHVPETVLTGRGDAALFHAGRVVRGTWTKKGAAAPVRLFRGRTPLTVPAGHTWVELLPEGKSGGSLSY